VKLRLLAPAAAPLGIRDLWCGLVGLFRPAAAVTHVHDELRQSLGVRHVFLVSSGRAALTLILRALHRTSPRRAVVLPAYTCFSVPAAIVRAGLDVVLCDVDPVTLDYDYSKLEVLVHDIQPLCVVATHLFGATADVARVRAICSSRGVFVVDDAAQALGIVTSAGAAGTLGDVGFYSFGRGKAVTSVHGGAIVTHSADIGRELTREYATVPEAGARHGIAALVEAVALWCFLRPSLYWLPASLPFVGLGETVYSPEFPIHRLSGPQAGLLKRWQARLTQANLARATRVTALRDRVAGIRLPAHAPCIRLPLVCASRQERDRLYAESRQQGLGFSLMYPTTVAQVPELRRFAGEQHFPGAERLADCLLTIPVHPLVSEQDRVAIEGLLSRVHLAEERS
jgi:perosamine synthetase